MKFLQIVVRMNNLDKRDKLLRNYINKHTKQSTSKSNREKTKIDNRQDYWRNTIKNRPTLTCFVDLKKRSTESEGKLCGWF